MSAERVLAARREHEAEAAICHDCEHGTHEPGQCEVKIDLWIDREQAPEPILCGCGEDDPARCDACGEVCDDDDCGCPVGCPAPPSGSNR